MLSYEASGDEFTVTVTYCGKTADFDVKAFDSTEGFTDTFLYYGYDYRDFDYNNNIEALLADAENGGLLRDYWIEIGKRVNENEYCWYGVKLTEDMLRLYNETSEAYDTFNLSSLSASKGSVDFYQVQIAYGGITIDGLHLYKVKANQLCTDAYYYSPGIGGPNYYVSAGSRDFVMAQILEGKMYVTKYVVFDIWGNDRLQLYNNNFGYERVTFDDFSDIDFGDYSVGLYLPAYLDGEKICLSVYLVPPYFHTLVSQYTYALNYNESNSEKVYLLPDGKLLYDSLYAYDYYWLDGFDNVIVYRDTLFYVDKAYTNITPYNLAEANKDAEKVGTFKHGSISYELYKLDGKYYITYNNMWALARLNEEDNILTVAKTEYVFEASETENEYSLTVYVDTESKELYIYETDDRESGGAYERWVYRDNGVRYYYTYDGASEKFVCRSCDFWEYLLDDAFVRIDNGYEPICYFYVAFLTEVTETAQ